MKKRIFTLSALALIMVTSIVSSACGENNGGSEAKEILFTVGTIEYFASFPTGHEKRVVVNSLTELNQIRDSSFFYSWQNPDEKVYYLDEYINQYDENFFAEKSLVLCLMSMNNGSFCEIEIPKISVKEKEMIFVLKRYYEDPDSAGDDVELPILVLIETSKSDVEGIQSISIEHVYGGIK